MISLLRRVATGRPAQKRAIVLAYDTLALLTALWAAIAARLGTPYVPENSIIIPAVGSVIGALIALNQMRIYKLVLRFFDLGSVSRIFFAAVIGATAWVALVYLTRATMVANDIRIMVPRSIGFIYCGFAFLLLFMGRYAMATIAAALGQSPVVDRTTRARRIAIYGASEAGVSLAESIQRNRGLMLCALFDDDPALLGRVVAGVEIENSARIPEFVRELGIAEVYLAMPNASRSERLAAIARLKGLNVQVKTIPAPDEIVSGQFTVTDVRPIDVNDLLRREPVEPMGDLMEQAVDGHVILVTGAGGSIGSEICRQLVRRKPAKLVLFDHSEFALYTIEQQLIEALADRDPATRPEVIAIVGSMLNELLIRDIIERQKVDTIYHAAAYKHVPLLEHNEVVGVENNVLGTWVLARAASDAGLTRFTMISTDKAVRPKSVMGASKRVAELIIQALAEISSTRFGIVRFGNVLDSSGSVVQRFRDQIERGGPVTVTDVEITRFFMSIPEATQLVIQASAMAQSGEVFVLDMGEPIRIAELARNMITLSGMTVRDEQNPLGDIEIQYVGLRPGEKLYEELFVGEETLDTAHPRIKMARERGVPWDKLRVDVEELRAGIFAGDAVVVRQKLQELITDDQGELSVNSDWSSGIARNPRVVG